MRLLTITLILLLTLLLPVFSFQSNILFAAEKRGQGVTIKDLPQNLKGTDIKKYFVTSGRKKVGVIQTLNNHLVVIHRDSNTAYFGQEGDTIFENDALQTLSNSRCRIRFLGEDIVTLAPETEFRVDNYVDQKAEGKKRSLFSMVKGKALFYAMRLFRYRETRFRLKTPTAVVGVRGTKFGVHVFEKTAERGDTSDGIRVADGGKAVGPYLAAADSGNRSGTLVAVGSGGVVAGLGEAIAKGKILHAGDVWDSISNLVRFDPDAFNNIVESTRIEPKGKPALTGQKQKNAEDAAKKDLDKQTKMGGETPFEINGIIRDESSDTTQQQRGEKTESDHTTPCGHLSDDHYY
jgi:hypothetical protein